MPPTADTPTPVPARHPSALLAAPPEHNLTAWLDRFALVPDTLYKLLDRWRDHAVRVVEEYDQATCSTPFLNLTFVLVAWCDHQSDATIDPTPLQRFYRLAEVVWSVRFPALRSHGPFPDTAVPSPRELADALHDAIDVTARIRLAAFVRSRRLLRDRRQFSDTEERVAQYVRENPGKLGKEIAYALGMSDVHARRIMQKLRSHGYRNVAGQGYFPPGVDG